MKMKKLVYLAILLSVAIASCKNEDVEFPDFEYQAVYFAHQNPVRTITFGEDIFDTSMDNEGRFKIMATTAGVYSNESRITIGVSVLNELCDSLIFTEGNNDVLPLPSNYYTLESNEIVIPKGSITGGVEVQLTQDFFNDSLAISKNYVLPMLMESVNGADSILSGVPLIDGAKRTKPGDWVVQPKDYVLYAVKYINEWHGFYLRRGQDVMTGQIDSTIVRHEEYEENDEVNLLTTLSQSELEFPLTFQDSSGNNITTTLILTFDSEGRNCTVSSGTPGHSASGTGVFVKDGEKNSWGNQDRDGLYLDYNVDLGAIQVSTVDTLVMRNRGVAFELFSPIYNN